MPKFKDLPIGALLISKRLPRMVARKVAEHISYNQPSNVVWLRDTKGTDLRETPGCVAPDDEVKEVDN